MSKIYLNKILAINIPLAVTYKGFKASYPAKDFTTKEEIPNKFEYLHIFSSAEYPDIALYANEYQNRDLEHFKAGDRLTVCKMEKKQEGKKSYFNLLFALEGDAMNSVVHAAPQMTPTQQKKVSNALDADKVKQIAISLQGYTQQIIPVLINKVDPQGVPWPADRIIAEALCLAVDAREAILKKAIELASPKELDSLPQS